MRALLAVLAVAVVDIGTGKYTHVRAHPVPLTWWRLASDQIMMALANFEVDTDEAPGLGWLRLLGGTLPRSRSGTGGADDFVRCWLGVAL